MSGSFLSSLTMEIVMSKTPFQLEMFPPKTQLQVDPDLQSLLTQLGDNKSKKIRFLHSRGYRNCDIAKILGIRDQFVSNVLRTPLKGTK
jgi:hypothetical protein